jgi:CDP-diacylglycerol---glycerol-3-phosphate 3-phosphatidyltransferase
MRITPATYITILRLFLILPVLVALANGYYVVGLALLVTALLTDWMDGELARKTNTVTQLGSFLDHFADKLLTHLVLLFFVVQTGLSAVAFGIFLARDFFVLGIRHLVAHKGVELSSMSLGKIKFVGQSVLLVALVVQLIIQEVMLQTAIDILLWTTVAIAVISAAQIMKKGYSTLA